MSRRFIFRKLFQLLMQEKEQQQRIRILENFRMTNMYKPCDLRDRLRQPLAAARCLLPPLPRPIHSRCSPLLYVHILHRPLWAHRVSLRSVCCHLSHLSEV